jgi:hypothetical protein
MTYRAYLRTFDGKVPPETKTITPDTQAALDAFAVLVNRADLDGQKMAAALTYNNRQIAFHRFDRKPGDADYWRDKLDEIEWPSGQVGRPSEMEGGKRVNVYLDAASLDAASRLGNGNVSDGIRKALKHAAG